MQRDPSAETGPVVNQLGGKKRNRNERRRLEATTGEVLRRKYDDGRVGLRLTRKGKVLYEVTVADDAAAEETLKRWGASKVDPC